MRNLAFTAVPTYASKSAPCGCASVQSCPLHSALLQSPSGANRALLLCSVQAHAHGLAPVPTQGRPRLTLRSLCSAHDCWSSLAPVAFWGRPRLTLVLCTDFSMWPSSSSWLSMTRCCMANSPYAHAQAGLLLSRAEEQNACSLLVVIGKELGLHVSHSPVLSHLTVILAWRTMLFPWAHTPTKILCPHKPSPYTRTLCLHTHSLPAHTAASCRSQLCVCACVYKGVPPC